MKEKDLYRHWRRRIFASTWLCYAGFYFCRKPFYIAKAALAESASLSASTLGLIGSAYLFAYTIGQFVSGALGSKYGARTLLLSGMTLSIACNLVFGISNNAATLAVFMALNGFAQASGWPGTVGTMANWFSRKERGSVMGIWSTNYQVGGVAANALAAWSLDAIGFRYSFFLGSLILLLVLVFFNFYQRNRPEDVGLEAIEDGNEEERQATGKWSRNALTNVALIGVFYFFIKFIRYSLWSWAPFFLAKNFQLTGANAGYLSTLFDLFGIGGVIVIGVLSDRLFNSRRAGISLIMILVMTIAAMGMATFGKASLTIFAISLALIGFTLYGPDALLSGAGAIDASSKKGAALAAGIINGMGSIGSIIQELVIGKMYDTNGGSMGPILMVLFAASAFAAGVLAVIVIRNRIGSSNV